MKVLLPLRTFLWTALLLIAAMPLTGLSISGTEWEGGIRWIGVSSDQSSGYQSDVFTNELIFRMPLTISERFEVVPSLSLSMLYYERTPEGRVVPVDMEVREMTGLVPIVELPLRWRFLRFKSHSYSLSGGIAAELPIPVGFAEPAATNEIVNGLYSDLRYLLPFARLSGRWTVGGRFHLVGRTVGYFPVHRLWDGSGAPFTDHLMVGLSVGFFFPSSTK